LKIGLLGLLDDVAMISTAAISLDDAASQAAKAAAVFIDALHRWVRCRAGVAARSRQVGRFDLAFISLKRCNESSEVSTYPEADQRASSFGVIND
jgi:hypothetical protein